MLPSQTPHCVAFAELTIYAGGGGGAARVTGPAGGVAQDEQLVNEATILSYTFPAWGGSAPHRPERVIVPVGLLAAVTGDCAAPSLL